MKNLFSFFQLSQKKLAKNAYTPTVVVNIPHVAKGLKGDRLYGKRGESRNKEGYYKSGTKTKCMQSVVLHTNSFIHTHTYVYIHVYTQTNNRPTWGTFFKGTHAFVKANANPILQTTTA